MKRTAQGRAWVKNSKLELLTPPWCSFLVPPAGLWESLCIPFQSRPESLHRDYFHILLGCLFFKHLLALHFPDITPFKVIFFWFLYFFARLSQPPSFDSLFLFQFIFSTTFCWCPFPSRHALLSSAFFLLNQRSLNFFHKGLLLLLLLLSRFSRVRLCATPETAAHWAPPSLGFFRQEHWRGLPFPSSMHESEKWK